MVCMPYTVYVDDSGTHNEARIVTGACCVSSVALWKRFERDWNEIGITEGFTHFHMTEFAGRRPDEWCRDCRNGKKTETDHPWRAWSNTKRKRVLCNLAETIKKHAEYGFGLAITKKDYDEFVLGTELKTLNIALVGERHYTFNVQSIAGRLADWRTSRRITQPMKYVFDGTDDPKQKDEIARLFIESSMPERVIRNINDGFIPTGYSWESRKAVKQLLSADMLAWVSAKVRASQLFTNCTMGKEATMVNEIFRQKLQIAWITREQLEKWAKEELAMQKKMKGQKTT
jgi:hypothetical protein